MQKVTTYVELRKNRYSLGYVNEAGEKTEVLQLPGFTDKNIIRTRLMHLENISEAKTKKSFHDHAHDTISSFLEKEQQPHRKTTETISGKPHTTIQTSSLGRSQIMKLHDHMKRNGFEKFHPHGAPPSTASTQDVYQHAGTHFRLKGSDGRNEHVTVHNHMTVGSLDTFRINHGAPSVYENSDVSEIFGLGKKDPKERELKKAHDDAKRALHAAKKENADAWHNHEGVTAYRQPELYAKKKAEARDRLLKSGETHKKANANYEAAKEKLQSYRNSKKINESKRGMIPNAKGREKLANKLRTKIDREASKRFPSLAYWNNSKEGRASLAGEVGARMDKAARRLEKGKVDEGLFGVSRDTKGNKLHHKASYSLNNVGKTHFNDREALAQAKKLKLSREELQQAHEHHKEMANRAREYGMEALKDMDTKGATLHRHRMNQHRQAATFYQIMAKK